MSYSWGELATESLDQVHQQFGHRVLGIGGTWLGTPNALPTEGRLRRITACLRSDLPPAVWNYWWQAHYLDAICDAGFHFWRAENLQAARVQLVRGKQLVRGVWLRNLLRFSNYFFDDMAWLVLAAAHLDQLALALHEEPSYLARTVQRTLGAELYSAHDQVLAGGLYWSRARNFKNTPVNSPAALHFARSGDTAMARALVGWMRERLYDPQLGLYLDGIHLTQHGHRLDRRVFTYNQGPIIGALLELGQPEDLGHVAELVSAVNKNLVTPTSGIRLESGADGGLFTGILCRYLAFAARDTRLPLATRQLAATLVEQTAMALPVQQPSQLSGAVQRTTLFFAAATVRSSLTEG